MVHQKQSNNFWKYLLAAVAFLLLSLPLIQRTVLLTEEFELTGAFEPGEAPEWSWENWFERTYQEQTETYANESVGFRPTLVRVNSQLKWSLFGEATGDAVAGQNGYLYTQAYINAYLGKRNVGTRYNEALTAKMKTLQDELDSVGTPMVVVLAPGKATFFPEYLPQEVLAKGPGVSTYDELKVLMPAAGVRFVDMDQWFREMKDTASYPLFPQGGVHWSDYGKYLAADSLTRYVENLTGDQLPELVLDTVRMLNENIRSDYDVGATMNLFWRSPTYPMPYPTIRIKRKKTHRPLRVIGVGDSYYLGLHSGGLSEKVFGNGMLWYYCRTPYPYDPEVPKVTDLNIWEELVAADAVIVMATVATANELGWGILDKAMGSKYGEKSNTTEDYIRAIRRDPAWMKAIKLKAREAGVSNEEMVRIDAEFMAEQMQGDP